MSKYLDLARKLKALADRGIGGERINAEAMLQEVMKRHGITMHMIEGDEVMMHRYEMVRDQQMINLFSCVARQVLNENNPVAVVDAILSRESDLVVVTFKASESQRVEIELLFNFHQPLLEQELDNILVAYIMKNKILPSREVMDAAASNRDEPPYYDPEHARKMREYIELIDKNDYQKRL